jgi:hypothetical protein
MKSARARQGLPEHSGLRAGLEHSERDRGIRPRFADAPLDGDHVCEVDGLRIFVADELADAIWATAQGSGADDR